ncbi:MAG: 4'-phosphopantetheinyl transferase superfamily protein [Pseudomonadota bacterium]|nr:4'-phosphopantetheinyl transferase superfamily protein [Pseudomonadota bacterium]
MATLRALMRLHANSRPDAIMPAPTLAGIELQLLQVPDAAAALTPWYALLTSEERARARRYRRVSDAAAFMIARGALRLLLARRLGCAPDALAIVTGDHGKPGLACLSGQSTAPLEFNVSHSAGLVLIGVAPGGAPIGVDIEGAKPMPRRMAIARRYFAPAEIAALDALPEDEQAQAFLRCWSRKEAVLKACGSGLAGGLQGFSVPVSAGLPVADNTGAVEVHGWALCDVPVPPGYWAALAFRRGLAVLAWPQVLAADLLLP